MKTLKITIAVLFFSAIFTACKKEKAAPTAQESAITGTWEGKYGYGTNDSQFFYSFKVKPDGTMQEIDAFGDIAGEGTWTLNGNTFTATHHFLSPYNKIFISTATFDPATKKLVNGSWKYSDKPANEGKWFMNKK
ncbi:MAG: hypothetical protein QM791_13115 [Ferruginibacter sp.]